MKDTVLHVPASDLKETELHQDLQSFILDCKARQLTAGTIEFYQKKLRNVEAYLSSQGVTRSKDITPTVIRTLMSEMQADHNPGGVHMHFRCLKAFLNFLVLNDILDINPMTKVKAPKQPTFLLEPVDPKTVALMLDACSSEMGERDAAMLLMLLDTGLRAQELLDLNIEDWTVESGKLRIKNGKGQKERMVFLGNETRKALLKYLRTRPNHQSTEPMFLADDGKRLGYHGLYLMMRRRAGQAGVSAPSPHDFRRAFALISLRGGIDVYSLQKLMGHSDLTVLRRYLAQNEEDLKKAHDKAGPVDQMLGKHR